MGTFVSPIRGAAVAMPFTIARRAFAVREESLTIVARVVSGQELQKGTNRIKRVSREQSAEFIMMSHQQPDKLHPYYWLAPSRYIGIA